MSHLKTVFYISLALLSFSLTGCQKQESQQTAAAETKAAQQVQSIAIGFQKSALNLLVARNEKLLEQQIPNTKIEWKEFPAGPQMLEALAVGAVDYGYVGNTPPIFAQAADKALSYVAFEKVAGNSLAVVVPKDSAIQTIQQLKGKRIAVQKGSSAHELLAKTLEKPGLSWSEI